MRETLPDVVIDERAPILFMAGFSILLFAMIGLLIWTAIMRARARRAGIYRKYATRNDLPTRRRTV